MGEVFKKIENEIARQLSEMERLREDLDRADSNDVAAQVRIAQEISARSIRLKATEDLYKSLRGEK